MTQLPSKAKRELAKKERREQILRGAATVFLERGISAATMEQVARAAGVSKGCLYLYFQSKDELFLTIALQVLGDLGARLEAVEAQEHPNGRETLRQLLHTHVNYASSEPARFQAALSWLRTRYRVDGTTELFDEYRTGIARMQAVGIRAVSRAVEDGSLNIRVSPERYLLQLWGALFGLITIEQNGEELARRNPTLISSENIAIEFIDHTLGLEAP